MRELGVGTQVIYVPTHAGGDVNHPDCERGFVTSVKRETVFYRFWREDLSELRTKSCSEGCDASQLIVADSVPQSRVNYALTEIQAGRDSEATREVERLVRQKLGDALDGHLREAFLSGRDPQTKAKMFGIRYSARRGDV